jgi:hypothetical protein
MSRFHLRILVPLMLGILPFAACSGPTSGGPDASQSVGSGPSAGASVPADQGQTGAGGSSLVAAAAAVTDACSLVPMDLASSIVSNASAPQSQTFPPYQCTISNGTSVLQVTIGAYDAVDPLIPNEPVAGLGVAAYLQKQQPDDAYLKVILDPAGGAVYVEVAGHDGKDHGDDAVAVAQRVLEALR